MLITKRQDVTKPGFCKILWRKLRLRRSLLLVLIQFFLAEGGGGGGVGRGNGWCGSGLLFEFEWEGGGLGVGAYSNKYGKNLSRQFLPSPRKAIPSLHRTLATGQTLHKDQKFFIWPIFLKLYLRKNCNLYAAYQLSPCTKYSSEFNSKISVINFNF